MSTTVGFTAQQIAAIAMVGKVVTYANAQWTVHSVEGDTWYAFNDNGLTTVDCDLTIAHWLPEPSALIVPAGHAVGDGFGAQVPIVHLERRVCLSKSYR